VNFLNSCISHMFLLCAASFRTVPRREAWLLVCRMVALDPGKFTALVMALASRRHRFYACLMRPRYLAAHA